MYEKDILRNSRAIPMAWSIIVTLVLCTALFPFAKETNAMEKIMFQLRDPSGHPTVESICKTYGFKREEIDAEFGIIETDKGLYTILVDAAAKPRIEPTLQGSDPAVGFFATRKIEPFDRAADRLRQFEEARGYPSVDTAEDEDARKNRQGDGGSTE